MDIFKKLYYKYLYKYKYIYNYLLETKLYKNICINSHDDIHEIYYSSKNACYNLKFVNNNLYRKYITKSLLELKDLSELKDSSELKNPYYFYYLSDLKKLYELKDLSEWKDLHGWNGLSGWKGYNRFHTFIQMNKNTSIEIRFYSDKIIKSKFTFGFFLEYSFVKKKNQIISKSKYLYINNIGHKIDFFYKNNRKVCKKYLEYRKSHTITYYLYNNLIYIIKKTIYNNIHNYITNNCVYVDLKNNCNYLNIFY